MRTLILIFIIAAFALSFRLATPTNVSEDYILKKQITKINHYENYPIFITHFQHLQRVGLAFGYGVGYCAGALLTYFIN